MENEYKLCFIGLAPGLNFINVLCTAFTLPDPKSVKKTVKLSIFFTLSGSTSVKAVRRMLMKLTPGFQDNMCHNWESKSCTVLPFHCYRLLHKILMMMWKCFEFCKFHLTTLVKSKHFHMLQKLLKMQRSQPLKTIKNTWEPWWV